MTRAFLLAAVSAAFASMASAALPARRQTPPIIAAPGAIAVVDVARVFTLCAQCRVANAALEAEAQTLRARRAELSAPLEAEGRALEALVAALPQGRRPVTALQARLRTFQTTRNNAAHEFEQRLARLQRELDSVRAQIAARMRPAARAVMHQRGATSLVERGSATVTAGQIDITEAVVAIIDQNPEPFDLHAAPPTNPR